MTDKQPICSGIESKHHFSNSSTSGMNKHAAHTQILTGLFTMTSWYVLNESSGLSQSKQDFFCCCCSFSCFLHWAVLQPHRLLKRNRCQTTDSAPEYLFGFDRQGFNTLVTLELKQVLAACQPEIMIFQLEESCSSR